MNYLLDNETVFLKDSWVFINGKDIHLFYLADNPNGGPKDRVFGHAVSVDWLNWKTLEPVDPRGGEGEWDSGTPGTAHVFKYDDGLFYMAYTGRRDTDSGPVEHISVLASDDLVEWKHISSYPVWPCPESPPYESHGALAQAAWRDPVVCKNASGEWQALCAARLDYGSLAGRGCVARAVIKNITEWVTVSPLEHPYDYSVMEVPEVFRLDGKDWMIFSTGGKWWGQSIHTPSKRNILGTFYFVAADESGLSWCKPEDNLLIGSGNCRADAYVARVIDYDGELLCYHHYHGSIRAVGMPKTVASDGDCLYLKPWKGLSEIDVGPADVDEWKELPPAFSGLESTASWAMTDSCISAVSECGGSVLCSCNVASDVDISARIRSHASTAGMIVGMSDKAGLYFTMNSEFGEMRLGMFEGSGAYGPVLDAPLDVKYGIIEKNREYKVRLILRDRFCDVFVDDKLCFCIAEDFAGRSDGIGLYAENGSVDFYLESIRRIEPLKTFSWDYFD